MLQINHISQNIGFLRFELSWYINLLVHILFQSNTPQLAVWTKTSQLTVIGQLI